MPAVHHQLDIFDSHLYLARSKTEWAGLRRRFNNAFPTINSLGRTEMCVHTTTALVAVCIYISPNMDTPERIETAAHEAAHAARFILDHAGERDRTLEVEPYLVGWLTRWIWQHLP